jgi:hypothetical protein
MGVVWEAIKDVKNWKASVWWLERRYPERYGGRTAGVVTARQLKAFVGMLFDVLDEELCEAELRERLVLRLQALVRAVDELLFDDRDNPLAATSLIDASPADVADDLADDAVDVVEASEADVGEDD